MRRLFRETRGAVTIFVTLLLIPAILVSGTAVDLARIHSARSVLQDANQLAANSVLTQYNALLYDLYGLFGVAKDDPILGQLLDDYIRVSVFGESYQNRKLGTLQLLYGSDISLEQAINDDMNLEDTRIIRRQIEEYMKFRGPVIIVEEIIKAIDGNTLKADTEVIGDKAAIDSLIAELSEKYKELYDAIIAADKCPSPFGGITGGYYASMSSHLGSIRDQFIALEECYSDWENVSSSYIPGDTDDPGAAATAQAEYEALKKDYKAKYAAIMANIKAFTVGGTRGSNWSNGRWRTTNSGTVAIESIISNAKQTGENFKPNFDVVVRIAGEIDSMHDDLTRKVDELERKLNSGECSEELKKGLTEKHGTPPMSLIERYRDILKWKNITAMSKTYRDGGYSYIDNEFIVTLDGVKYRNVNNPAAGSLTLAELANLSSNPAFALSESISAANSKAALFASFQGKSVSYGVPPGFKTFAEHPGQNREFFEALTNMVNQPVRDPIKMYDGQEDAEGADSGEKQRNLIENVLKLVNTVYDGLTNNPLGAKKIEDADTPDPERLNIFEILTLIPQAISNPVVNIIKDPGSSMQGLMNYLLLLTYGASMFSNYTTSKPDSLGKTRDDLNEIEFTKTITDVPISPEVNYFFQSEWEYLYHGSKSAGANLSAITRLLFLVRLVCDYITVFSVNEVTTIVLSIQTAFAWFPPLGLFLGELARGAFVAAEALVDVVLLRTGYKVPLIKNALKNEWVCSPGGIMAAIGKITEETLKPGNTSKEKNSESGGVVGGNTAGGGSEEEDKGKGLSYSQYMLFFFIAHAVFYIGGQECAADELAERVGDLIEWNLINYESKSNADESKMAEAVGKEDRFRLCNMYTGFSLSTTVDLRMLFLSLPFAARGANGVVPPGTLQITVTDYRGY